MYQSLSNVPVPHDFSGRNKIKVQLWYLCWLFLFRPSPHFLNSFRVFLIRIFGGDVSFDAKIRPSAYISYPWNLTLGDDSFIGDRVFIDSLGDVIIGNNVSISNDVYITSGTHDYSDQRFSLLIFPVRICDEAWLSVRSTVLPGVTIGRGAILGACSLAIKSIPENQIWAGIPAAYKKDRV